MAVSVYERYRKETGDETPTVIASTANPYKFSDSVLKAISGPSDAEEFEKVEQLHRATGCEVPAPLSSLRGKTPRFTGVCNRADMERTVYELLHIDVK